MTEEIVTSTPVGKHNEDLDLSAARILEGGSWKTQRTIVLLPMSRTISARVYLSHWNLLFPMNQLTHKMVCLGLEVGEAYTKAIEAILSHPQLREWEYVLTLESDNMPPQDGLLKLLRQMEAHPEFACIGGLYWTKGPGGQPMIYGDATDPVLNFRPQVPRPGQLVECCGTGMGFNLWRLSMFKDEKLRRPWFKTVGGEEGLGTQDLYFWADARKQGYRCAVDCSVLVGHYSAEEDMCW